MDKDLLFFLLAGAIANWIAYKRGFYQLNKTLPNKLDFPLKTLSWTIVAYLLFSFFVSPLLIKIFSKKATLLISVSLAQLLTLFFSFCTISFIVYKQSASLFKKIWKIPFTGQPTFIHDFFYGVMCWFLSFPIVVVISQISDSFIYKWLHAKPYEQLAVKFVKMTLNSPMAFLFALLIVIFLAPLLEELVFRGCIQTYCRSKFGSKPAILISSASFALLHFSPGQGLGNVTVLTTLIALGCFLGFIYEKRGSLFTSFGLHMTFNAVSIFRILFDKTIT